MNIFRSLRDKVRRQRLYQTGYGKGLVPLDDWLMADPGPAERIARDIIQSTSWHISLLHFFPNPRNCQFRRPDGSSWSSIPVEAVHVVDAVDGYYEDSRHIRENGHRGPTVVLGVDSHCREVTLAHEVWHVIFREFLRMPQSWCAGIRQHIVRSARDIIGSSMGVCPESRTLACVVAALQQIYESQYGEFDQDADPSSYGPRKLETFRRLRALVRMNETEEWLARSYAQVFAANSGNTEWIKNARESPIRIKLPARNVTVLPCMGAESLAFMRIQYELLFRQLDWV